jgi:hypothetical protein
MVYNINLFVFSKRNRNFFLLAGVAIAVIILVAAFGFPDDVMGSNRFQGFSLSFAVLDNFQGLFLEAIDAIRLLL